MGFAFENSVFSRENMAVKVTFFVDVFFLFRLYELTDLSAFSMTYRFNIIILRVVQK